MFKEIFLGSVFTFAALGVFTPDAEAGERTITITIPEDAEVKYVDSTNCEPIYIESQNTLYVPGCYHDKNKREETIADRVIDYTVNTGKREVENTVTNAIGRQIYEMGNKMGDVLGTW